MICYLCDINSFQESQVKRVTRSIKTKIAHESLVPIFDTMKFSTKEIRQYKYRVLDFVSKLLSDKDFTGKVCWVVLFCYVLAELRVLFLEEMVNKWSDLCVVLLDHVDVRAFL